MTALLAGSAAWSVDHPKPESVTELVSLVEILALVASLATVWYATVRPPTRLPLAPAIICTASFTILLINPLLRTFRQRPISRSLRFNLVARGIAASAIVVSELIMLPGWSAMFVLPFAIAAGTDASLTARYLGWQLRPVQWWKRFLSSPFHLGVIGALLATLVYHRNNRFDPFPAYVATHLAVITALVVAWVIGTALRRVDIEMATARLLVVEDERRRRAHWLHDDVCAQLRLVSLKVQTRHTTPEEVVQLLDGLDHQFRLRQLDELLESGPLQVAELLQPYIRRAQNVGVIIEQVPTFDDAALSLSGHEARLFARSAAMFTSNALNASATRLSYFVEEREKTVRLTVCDDGPGFELDDVSHGRGLWSLRHELRPGGLEIGTSPLGGASVTAVIPLSGRS